MAYLLLLAASHGALLFRGPSAPPPAGVRFADVPAVRDDSPAEGVLRLAYLRWDPARESARPPVILLHGSPGGASDFETLGPMLAAQGRTVIAVDQPGFGNSTQGVVDRSLRTAAHAVIALMDDLKIPRAHVVGWSNGGGTGLNIADLSPDRVESLTMMAAIGAQETEGSGSYGFEHFKYALGYGAATAARGLVPHFGLLDGLSVFQGSMQNFWDSDQRPLEGIMRRLAVPTMILHGRDDFLVPAWAAERHHELIPKSRLVMLRPLTPWFPTGHFIPFMQAEKATLHLSLFFRQVEDGSWARDITDEGEVFDEAPYTNPLGFAGERADRTIRGGPWWAVALGLALLAMVWPVLAAAMAGYFLGRHQLDLGVAVLGLGWGLLLEAAHVWAMARLKRSAMPTSRFSRERVGRSGGPFSATDWSRRFGLIGAGRPARPFQLGLVSRFQPWMRTDSVFAAGLLRAGSLRLGAGVFVGSLMWAFVMGLAGSTISARLAVYFGGLFEGGWAYAGVVAGVLLAIPVLNFIQHLLTWTGRQRVKAELTRTIRHEFWPGWVFYAPLVPWVAWLSIKHKGVMTFSCCNPAIDGSGGIIGESKARIMENLGHAADAVLEAHLVDAGPPPQERSLRIKRLLEANPGLRGPGVDGFPAILKPDGGQRGHAVRLARTHDDVLAYFQEMTRAAVVQRYHPGPRECGVLWARREDKSPISARPTSSEANETGGRAPEAGYIFSVTRKEFPVITGDGRRTFEELIYRHQRLRCQARVFLTRFADHRSRVLGAGEEVRLAVAGNHCQGTLFLDGADLATGALAGAIDRIARGFPRGDGGGLDFGRFDIRYESDEELRAGRGFGIVELNGTTSESTNLYDPRKNVLWAYRVLFRQWATLYRLGAARKGEGVRPISPRELFRSLRVFYRARPGSSVSD